MKVILTGWQGSKKIISASSYLLWKYLTGNFDITYVNVGPFDGKLFKGKYAQLLQETLSKEEWCNTTANYLSQLDDEIIILGDDDFFLSQTIDVYRYLQVLHQMEDDPKIVCGKLCINHFYNPNEYTIIKEDMFELTKEANFSVALQFCLWRRDYLIELLRQSKDPWDFEVTGSKILNASDKKVIGTLDGVLRYPDRSAVSQTHPGKVSVLGNKTEDIEALIKKGLLVEDELQMGMWNDDHITSYKDGKDNQYACLEGHYDYDYNKLILDLCLK